MFNRNRSHSVARRALAALVAAAAFYVTAAPAAPVSVKLDLGQEVLVANKPQKLFVKLALKGGEPLEPARRAPVNVALVLDRSGSMSGEKLRHAKQAALMSLDHLGRDDILSVVTYDDTVDVLVPATRLYNREKVEAAIAGIEAGGSTALFAGVSKGAAELRKFLERERVNRVILLSDGQANQGPSSPMELAALGRRLAGEGMTVTTIGLGLDYNEDLMVKLAGASDGNHFFVEEPAALAGVFRDELGELGTVVAQGVTVTIHCTEGVRPLRVLGREAEIYPDHVVARINQLGATQEKYLLLEVEVPAGKGGSQRELARAEVAYDDPVAKRSEQLKLAANIRYSASDKEVTASVKKDVMVSATEQLGAQMDDKALELRDKGDAAGAQDVFRRKAEFLRDAAEQYESKVLMEQSAESAAASEAAAAPSATEWKKARKELRAKQYSVQQKKSSE